MKKSLHVSLKVNEPSIVELEVSETVQLDRLLPAKEAKEGYIAERRGNLLDPGVTTLALEQGLYFFRTLTDARLKVVHGGVETTVGRHGGKNPWPLPPPVMPFTGGDEPDGETPSLSVE